MNNLSNIYSPENIARSRARAAQIRVLVSEGRLEPEWLTAAAEIDAGAKERELLLNPVHSHHPLGSA